MNPKGIHYTHRIDGEKVVVTGHTNGITIYDSDDEQDQELLDEVFAELYEPATVQYTVSVACSFDATGPEDALTQMIAWLDDNAATAGYRLTDDDTGESMFMDAENVLPTPYQRAVEFFALHGHADDSFLEDYNPQRYPFLRADTYADSSRHISAWSTYEAARDRMLAGVTSFEIVNVVTGRTVS